MNDIKYKLKENIRHISIRKKTASRICSIQVLYSTSFLNCEIDLAINSYVDNYLPSILRQLDLKKMDFDLFDNIVKGVCKNVKKIDEIISNNLLVSWSVDRLSETEKSILRSAVYELLFERKFKKITIINEYISIIGAFGGSPDFANGILENISKEIK